MFTRALVSSSFIVALALPASSQPLPSGYWPLAESQPVMDKTETIRLAPDLSRLTAGERAAIPHLLAAGEIMQKLYELQRHRSAESSLQELRALDARQPGLATRNLLDLYRLFMGPVATDLENERHAILPVEAEVAGKNVYPWGIKKEEVEAFAAAHPDARSELLAERTVVRRASAETLKADLATFAKYPLLGTLHARTKANIEQLSARPDPATLYAVPYAVAWAGQILEVHRLLNLAADALDNDDPEFAGYLRNRARDFLANDYESGDAAWVTGHFRSLNMQIGAYETYDDALFGVKAFHSASLLIRNDDETKKLTKALGSIQEIEDALPYDHHKRIRDDIPVGVYEIIADFGQARGTNTATILPNDPLYSRRYGRTIMLRENIMRNPAIHQASVAAWKASVASPFENDLDASGPFYRTLWHEIGHYLGVDRDLHGRTLDIALQDYADSVEEMKSDLVSLFGLHILAAKGLFTPAELRSVQAAGIRRTLQNTQPRVDQPYQRMQLVQFNYFLEQGLLRFDPKAGELAIDYARYKDVVGTLLRTVLELQRNGDRDAAKAFFDRYTSWRPDLHAVIAKKIRDAEGPRYRLVRYAALGE